MIRKITERLFSDTPKETIYHYTSFRGLIGIVESQSLWTSDIRYMNDSAELIHTANLIRYEVNSRINAGHNHPVLLNKFIDWIDQRIASGHLLFAASFRSNGNLLSQWRGYSTVGTGVSLGFDPGYILQCCEYQDFEIGHCIYDPDEQKDLIAKVIDAIEVLAMQCETSSEADLASLDYLKIFDEIESDILKIAAILKHPSFEEEDEWRIVSPIIADASDTQIKFREGTSMIVPYIDFKFNLLKSEHLRLEHVFLGPTPNIHNSMNSLDMFFRKHATRLARGISYCQIPFRQR